MKNPLKKSSGVALITVLLVVASATIAAVSISARLQVDIRRTENLLRADQAWLHALGVESWAKGVLVEDFKRAPEIVTRNEKDEEWVNPMTKAVDGGEVSGKIIDQQGLFNLNNLWNTEKQEIRIVHRDRFVQLLKNVDVDLDGTSEYELATALIDWLDEDNTPRNNGGAEDDYYQSLEPVAYSTANRELAHASELLLVKGFTKEVYDKLKDFVTALPGYTELNVNTAPAKILQSLTADVIEKQAESLFDELESTPYPNVGDFMKDDTYAGLIKPLSRDGLNVKSNYFRVRSDATVGKARVVITSLLKRTDQGEVTIVHRMRGDKFNLNAP